MKSEGSVLTQLQNTDLISGKVKFFPAFQYEVLKTKKGRKRNLIYS